MYLKINMWCSLDSTAVFILVSLQKMFFCGMNIPWEPSVVLLSDGGLVGDRRII